MLCHVKKPFKRHYRGVGLRQEARGGLSLTCINAYQRGILAGEERDYVGDFLRLPKARRPRQHRSRDGFGREPLANHLLRYCARGGKLLSPKDSSCAWGTQNLPSESAGDSAGCGGVLAGSTIYSVGLRSPERSGRA
jgi:hypothetical protein